MSDKSCQPVDMKIGAPPSFITEEAAVQKLADKLRKQLGDKLPDTSADGLQTLSTSLDQKVTGKKVADAFLRAGGLPTLIGHLGGTSPVSRPSPSTHPDIMASATPNVQAAMDMVLEAKDGLEDTPTLLHPPLKSDLRNARLALRGLAADALRALAITQPGQLKAMAEAGVMVRLLELYIDIGDLPLANLTPESTATYFADRVAALARLLMESGTIAAQDLKQAICGPSAVQTFGAIAILQVCMTRSGGDLVGPLVDAGIVSALKHTLAHESPYCVAAAAGVLGMIGKAPGRGKAAIEASDAVAALVRVVKRSPSPGNPETETGLFRRTVFKGTILEESDRLHFRSPTAIAIAGLFATAPYSVPMLDTFIKAGGVPALLRVLGDSSCPLTVRYSLAVIETLLGKPHQPGTGSRIRELADELFKSGFCRAALQALENGSKAVRKSTLGSLATFLRCMSKDFYPAAITALMAGNAVEILKRHMDDEDTGTLFNMFLLLMHFKAEPGGKKEVYTHGNVDERMDGFEDGGLKNWDGNLRSHMHGSGSRQADPQPPLSGAAAPVSTSGRPGGSPTCRAATRIWTCSRCGVSSAELVGIGKLKQCSGCRSVRYCGRACQMADWPAHKTMCKRKQAAGK